VKAVSVVGVLAAVASAVVLAVPAQAIGGPAPTARMSAAEQADECLALPIGDVDEGFGTDCKVTTDSSDGLIGADALVALPDGKLVAAGEASERPGGFGPDFGLARFTRRGALDTSFGTGGTVGTDIGGWDEASALAVQPDGRLVAAGRTIACNFVHLDFALARYLPDGTLDPSFGTGGKVTTRFDRNDGATAVVVQPDGKLVAAGRAGGDENSDYALARYLPDGTLDTSFGTDGKVTTDLGGFDVVNALVVLPDGKLVAAGSAGRPSDGTSESALARYLPDGTLDPSFGTGGTVRTDRGGSANALVVQGDKLVAAGDGFGTSVDFLLARYLPDGSLDPSFGTGGTVTTDFGNSLDEANALAVQGDKLVAAGSGRGGDTAESWDFALASYRPDGTLDTSFGTGGTVTTDFGGGLDDEARALAWQADGELVAAGVANSRFAEDAESDPVLALARYHLGD
jgi:uncharacterized delta-60 repeat protein